MAEQIKVLNRTLYDSLRTRLGEVRVSHAHEQLEWSWDTTVYPSVPSIDAKGEQYNVCCPCCGDTRFRLGIGHRLFSPLDTIRAPQPLGNTYHCHNEHCRWSEHPSYAAVRADIAANPGVIGLVVALAPPAKVKTEGAPDIVIVQPLPQGFTPLNALPLNHPARAFVRAKYGFDPDYLAGMYGAGYCGGQDPKYPNAYNRVIFPIWFNRRLVSWQGRTIDPRDPQRWYFPTGFKKTLYNWDVVSTQRNDVIVIAEGIPAAIAGGPTATAIFGKEIDPYRAGLIAKNFRTAVIATDPETQLPDPLTRKRRGRGYVPGDKGRVFANEIIARLTAAGLKVPAMPLRYPPDVMAAAAAAVQQRADEQAGIIPKVPKDKRIKIPDLADIGLSGVHKLLAAMPTTHRSTYLCQT